MRGAESWWRAALPGGAHDSLIADKMWERLRDEYVFRGKITTCAFLRVRFEISWTRDSFTPRLQPAGHYSFVVTARNDYNIAKS
jgi:hypothetical protein